MPASMAADASFGGVTAKRKMSGLQLAARTRIANNSRNRTGFSVAPSSAFRVTIARRSPLQRAETSASMNTRTIASLLACAFLLVLIQLVTLLIQPIAGVVCGPVLAILSVLLLKFFQIELPQPWARILLPAGSSVLGVAIVFFFKPGQEVYLWFAPLLALVLSGIIVATQHFGSKRCALCGRRLRGRVAFDCPRCGMTVCDHTCWVFEASRCRLCEQNRVPIFSPDGRWWDRQLGPRTAQGRCQLCQSPASEVDLRPCRKCGRPQCRECWDAANGQCSRCQWTIEDLPDTLRPYILTGSGEGRLPVRAR